MAMKQLQGYRIQLFRLQLPKVIGFNFEDRQDPIYRLQPWFGGNRIEIRMVGLLTFYCKLRTWGNPEPPQEHETNE